MAMLKSKLFRHDQKLEAAANKDLAHVTLGVQGDHVEKIQLALIVLDAAPLVVDGLYGPATAKAVREYKRKRRIINNSYQSSADDIVGKMTIASLDEEFASRESLFDGPITVDVVRPSINLHLAFGPPIRLSLMGIAAGHFSDRIVTFNSIIDPKLSKNSMVLDISQTGSFQVKGAVGWKIHVSEGNHLEGLSHLAIADADPNASQNSHTSYYVRNDLAQFEITGVKPGSCLVTVVPGLRSVPRVLAFPSGMHVKINDRRKQFVSGVQHNHAPCRNWQAVQNHEDMKPKLSDDITALGVKAVVNG